MRGLLSDAVLVARTTVRRRLRRRREQRVRFLASVVVLGLLWLRVFVRYVDVGGGSGGVAGVVPRSVVVTATESGPEYVAVLTGVDPLALGRVVVGAAWLGWVYVSALGVTGDAEDLSVGLGTLQATDVRAVVLADAIAGNVRRIVRYGTHAVLAAVALVLGGGSGLAVPAWLATILGLSVSASLTGYVLGLGGRWVLVSSERRWRYRHLAGGLAIVPVLGFFAPLFYPDRTLSLLPTAATLAAWFPPAWYADLILTPVGAVPTDPLRGVAVVAGTALVAPPLYLATARLANRVWFVDRGDAAFYDAAFDRLQSGDGAVGRLEAVVAPVSARPTRALVRRSYLRLVRNPAKLYLVASPVVLGAVVGVDGDPGDPTMPVFLAVGTAWGGGLLLGLNPLSMEGPALPSLLTAAVPGERVVRAAAITTLVATLPAALLGVALSGLLIPRPPGVVCGSLALALALVPAGALLAVGVGVAMPTVGDPSTDTRPDRYAAVAYSLAIAVVALPGALALAAPVGAWTPYDPVAVRAVGVGLSACLSVAAGVLAYRYAAEQFATMRL